MDDPFRLPTLDDFIGGLGGGRTETDLDRELGD